MNKRKNIVFIVLLLSVAAGLFAVPAKPGLWRIVTLADGREVRIELVGDEYGHCWRDADGLHYRELDNGQFVQIDAAHTMARARQMRVKAESRRAARRMPIGGDHEPYIGKRKGLVILTEFKNKSFVNHIDSIDSTAKQVQLMFDSICNHRNFKKGNFVGSVRDYFYDNSYGLFDLSFDVVGPVRMPKNYEYYGKDDPLQEEGYDLRPGEMVVTACEMVKDLVDFKDYDWDGDGMVEQVYILYAGKGQANGGNANTIWPHEYELEYTDYGKTLELDSVIINTYACSNELNSSNKTDGIGTMCHEFSHCLGIPDIYDIDYYNYGMSQWDIMSSGSYNGNGYRPAGYTSYEKMYAGWLKPIELAYSLIVKSMNPLTKSPEAYIIRNDGTPDEYLLLENRQRVGWDASLPGQGMLAVHVDFDSLIWENNMVNCTTLVFEDSEGNEVENTHQRCTLLPADNTAYSYFGVAGDAYPYWENDSITSSSKPAMTWYNPNSYGNKAFFHAIQNIAINSDGTMRFSYEKRRVEIPTGNFTFFETFDRCDGKGGNDDIWDYSLSSSSFLPDYPTWTFYSASGANQCAKIGNAQTKGYLLTPYMNTDDQQVLTFRAAPWKEEEGKAMVVTFLAGTDTLRIDTLEAMPVMQWSDFKLEVPACEKLQIMFSSTANRFFIDEIRVDNFEHSSIRMVNQSQPSIQQRYNLNGQRVSENFEGIVIMNGRKIVNRQRR